MGHGRETQLRPPHGCTCRPRVDAGCCPDPEPFTGNVRGLAMRHPEAVKHTKPTPPLVRLVSAKTPTPVSPVSASPPVCLVGAKPPTPCAPCEHPPSNPNP